MDGNAFLDIDGTLASTETKKGLRTSSGPAPHADWDDPLQRSDQPGPACAAVYYPRCAG